MELSNGFTIERRGWSVVVRFDRPEVRNPLSIEVVEALIETVAAVDASTKVMIFTGTDGVFASGADLREIALVDRSNAVAFAERGQRLMNMISAMEARTIAAVNGYCYGGALDLSLACDSRIAAANAEFSHPGGGLGIMTGWGGTQRLPRLIGESAALEMFLTGKRIPAAEAVAIGLIDEVAADPVAAAIQGCP